VLPRLTVPVLTCLFLGGCIGLTFGLSITTTAPNGAVEQIPATLSKPDGAGPFPHRGEGRLDAGRTLPEAGRKRSGGRVSPDDQDLSGGPPLV